MSKQSEFANFVIEQMALIGKPRLRAMFGGYGVYLDDRIFAIVVEDALYFKTDAINRAEFEALGLRPFTFNSLGKIVKMQYFEAPPEVFEDQQMMREWGLKGFEAGLRAAKLKPVRKKATTPRKRNKSAVRKSK